MKSVLLSGIAALAFSATGALAQSATDTSAQPSPAANAQGGEFITAEPEGMYRAPKLVGVAVYDSTNKSIGKISDLLVDKSGDIKAVVIGVGGFLGIGQKEVAVPYSAIHWQTEQRTVATNEPGTGGMAASNNASNNNASNNMANKNMANNTTGATTSGANTGNSAANTTGGVATSGMATGGMAAGDKTQTKTIDAAKMESYQGYPDRAVVDMSQAQLKAAPEFKYASNPAAMGDNTATPAKQQ